MPVIHVPINRLRFKDPIPAGMNPYTLLGLVPLLRNTAQDYEPILIDTPCPACGTATVLDGRHRWVAAVMAGRVHVAAEPEATS